MADIKKFLMLTDLHYGYERRNGHKLPLHDISAMNVALAFAKDFQPDELILAGDILDCGCISHHTKGKPGQTEGFRLLQDARECQAHFMDRLPRAKKQVYIQGNHDGNWLEDFTEEHPALEGMLDIKNLLKLENFEVIPSGGYYKTGKLVFCHGNQLSGGEHVAKAAVTSHEANIRFGHFHGTQVYTKSSPLDAKLPKTGISVGCLCRKNPAYGEGKPNRWSQGFLFGYILPDGTFNDYLVTIINGKAVINGKLYNGKT